MPSLRLPLKQAKFARSFESYGSKKKLIAEEDYLPLQVLSRKKTLY